MRLPLILPSLAGLLVAALLVTSAVQAQDTDAQELANNQPVAVVSLVWGAVTIKHVDGDYQPAVWLDPVYPEDSLKTAGPGSKLLVTYFFDNHQEVLASDSEAQVGFKTLTSQSGPAIRKDAARNPFGTGMDNPFVYTRKLVASDFEDADDPGAMARENTFLKSTVKPTWPPTFSWASVPGVSQYKLQIFDTTDRFLAGATVKGTRYKAFHEFNDASKGSTFQWQVTTPDNRIVTRKYSFMVLTRPLQDWLGAIRADFQGKEKAGKLERSDYTDYLLASAQLMQVDDVLSLCQQMARMNPTNPRVFRALTRAYLAKGCPAHAKQAHDTEIQLGGVDPILP